MEEPWGLGRPDWTNITLDVVLEINRLAVDGLVPNPGQLRTRDIEIQGSRHAPPPADDVPALVEDMITHINAPDEYLSANPVRLAAFALWRLNWIHPFEDGNGRTARALTHLVLVRGTGAPVKWLSRFKERKASYQKSLEAADEGWKRGKKLRLQNVEGFIQGLIRAGARE